MDCCLQCSSNLPEYAKWNDGCDARTVAAAGGSGVRCGGGLCHGGRECEPFLNASESSLCYPWRVRWTYNYSLKCESEDPVQYWMLHGRGQAYGLGTTSQEEFIEVDINGVLHFTEVKKEHEGDHLCVTTVSGVTKGVSVPMEVRPKPSENLWEDMYKAQFITGLIAALVCAVLFTAGCLVFRFRYREPKAVLLNGSEERGYHNQALDVESDNNTKL